MYPHLSKTHHFFWKLPQTFEKFKKCTFTTNTSPTKYQSSLSIICDTKASLGPYFTHVQNSHVLAFWHFFGQNSRFWHLVCYILWIILLLIFLKEAHFNKHQRLQIKSSRFLEFIMNNPITFVNLERVQNMFQIHQFCASTIFEIFVI